MEFRKRLEKLFWKKKAIGMPQTLIGWIALALMGMVVVLVGYGIATGKIWGVPEYIKNLFRFGR